MRFSTNAVMPVPNVTGQIRLIARSCPSENPMSNRVEPVRIAVLDDYQNIALSMADWSGLDQRATVTVFHDHLADPHAIVARLKSFGVFWVGRERTPMSRAIVERLPKLRLIASTALRNVSIDLEAAAERGVEVMHTGYSSAPTIELTWALILASTRYIVAENASLRAGGWQHFVGDDLAGRTIGVLGLGNIGGAVTSTAPASSARSAVRFWLQACRRICRGSPRPALISRPVSTRRRSVTKRLFRRPTCSTRTPTSSSLACRSSTPELCQRRMA